MYSCSSRNYTLPLMVAHILSLASSNGFPTIGCGDGCDSPAPLVSLLPLTLPNDFSRGGGCGLYAQLAAAPPPPVSSSSVASPATAAEAMDNICFFVGQPAASISNATAISTPAKVPDSLLYWSRNKKMNNRRHHGESNINKNMNVL